MIISTFIAELEGSRLTGYVPNPDGSKSGVTIASGFDIGQRSETEIKAAFTPALAGRLLPYVGKHKYEAVAALACVPLQISTIDESEINTFSRETSTQLLVKRWDESESLSAFTDLSDECQTVVASVAFQYGCLATKCPNFWQQITTLDWVAAYGNLCNFGDSYGTRRRKESELLAQWLIAG